MRTNGAAFIASTIALAILSAGSPVFAQPLTNQDTNVVDQRFVTDATNANYQEIDQARAELRSVNDPSVRLFAQTMIRDHTNSVTELTAQAKRLGLSIPPVPTTMPAAVPARTYMQQQVTAHQQVIAMYKAEANNGGDQSLKTYAATALPILNNHLAMAQQYLQTGHVTPRATPTP